MNLSKIDGSWKIRCFDKDGNPKWEDSWDNLVTDQALNYALAVTLPQHGASPIDTITEWKIGLTGPDPDPNPADTIAVHPGWMEVHAYEGDRKDWVSGAVEDKTVTNAENPAVFRGDTDGTIVGGAILVGGGILFSVGKFTRGNKPLDAGDTVEVISTYKMISVEPEPEPVTEPDPD